MKEEKKKIQNNFIVAAGLLALFILYTVAIMGSPDNHWGYA